MSDSELAENDWLGGNALEGIALEGNALGGIAGGVEIRATIESAAFTHGNGSQHGFVSMGRVAGCYHPR